MSANSHRRPALGENVPLGTLYDARTDTFLPQCRLMAGTIPPESLTVSPEAKVDIKICAGPSRMDKFGLLGFHHDLIASLIAGCVQSHGITKYLDIGRQPDGGSTAALLYRLSTLTELLTIGAAGGVAFDLEALRAAEATHVVVRVEWGVQSVIEIRPLSGSLDVAALADVAERLKMAMSIDTSSDAHQPSSAGLDIRIFSDTMEHPIVTRDLSEALSFIRLLPAQVRQLYHGKGRPISYELLPFGILGYMNQALAAGNLTACRIVSLDAGYVEQLVSKLDDLQASYRRLSEYDAYVFKHQKFVSKPHFRSTEERVNRGESGVGAAFTDQLSVLLKEVRSGVKPALELSRHLHSFAGSASSPASLLAAEEAEVRAKVEFAAAVVANGGIYVGFSGRSLSWVLEQNSDRDLYVMSYSAAALGQDTWDDNRALVMELLETEARQSAAVVIVDRDAEQGGEMDTGRCRVAKYQGGKRVVDDVLEQRASVSNKCLIRFDPATLDSREMQKPVKRRFIKTACPGSRCGSEIRDWICSECACAVEYGYTDEYIYCDCGRSAFWHWDFRCCSPTHGDGYTAYGERRLESLLKRLTPSDHVNILILGETGVGKSTFINAFVNYLTYGSLDEAKQADELVSVIPCAFSTQVADEATGEFVEHHVRIGHDSGRADEQDGLEGGSATQQTMVYPVTIGNRVIRLIDTPGIGDTRGLEYDRKNVADVLATLRDYDDLHGIIILVKPNNARLTLTFEFCMKELLTHLHRNAVSNLVFGLTGARASNYAPGDTFIPLKSIVAEHKDAGMSLSSKTIYCFDSESFRYLAAVKQNVPMPNEEDFRNSWRHSSSEAFRLLEHLAIKKPHSTAQTIRLNSARLLIAQLTKPMAEISAVIRKNINLCEEQMLDLQNERLLGDKLRKRLVFETTHLRVRKLSKPRTVCTDVICREFQDDGTGTRRAVYKTHCHAECYLIDVKIEEVAHPSLMHCAAFNKNGKCEKCQHNWQQHVHVKEEIEEYLVLANDKEIEKRLYQNSSDITLRQAGIASLERRITEYRQEHQQVSLSAARFVLFLRKDSIATFNNKLIEYINHLIEEEEGKVQVGGDPKKLRALREDKKKHIELVEIMEQNMRLDPTQYPALDETGVDREVKELYKLKHFGGNLRSVKEAIVTSHQATNREVMVCVCLQKTKR
ncbi:hypothetical protein B0H67DRAFT_664020 [Lasiosphaeris hirsuta]|uniref:G domain-containing protein n=1 Tax=Lasiosphaeris hirsuta TaxID=260670 RepID=A0AA40AEV5_9PEZI|nr:hypothetical protein B0H67DRAFT_664020 [Lasiosphaeris hirsuta]